MNIKDVLNYDNLKLISIIIIISLLLSLSFAGIMSIFNTSEHEIGEKNSLGEENNNIDYKQTDQNLATVQVQELNFPNEYNVRIIRNEKIKQFYILDLDGKRTNIGSSVGESKTIPLDNKYIVVGKIDDNSKYILETIETTEDEFTSAFESK